MEGGRTLIPVQHGHHSTFMPRPNRIHTIPKLAGFVLAAWLCVLHPTLDAADALGDDFSARPEIEKRLAAARNELRELPAETDPELRERLQGLEAICQFHLAAVDFLTADKDKRDKARLAVSAWNGLPQPPPYPILLLDEIRDKLATLEDSLHATETQLRIFTAESDATRDKLAGHQQAERRLMETAERANTAEARQNAQRAVKAEQLSSRIAAENIARTNQRIESQRMEMATTQSKKELATLQRKAIDGKATFSQAELDTVLQSVARERAEAAHALVAAASQQQATNPLLTWKTEFLDLEKTFWETRFAAHNQKDRNSARDSLTVFKDLKSRVDDWIEIAGVRLAGGTAATEFDPTEVRDGLLRLRQMERRIGFAIADIKGSHRRTPVLDFAKTRLLSLWDAELYLAEETDIVDGKKVATYRAVTIGKLARLGAILTVGWLLLRLLSRWVKAFVARKSAIPQATADLAGKWAFALGLLLLILYGLNTVSIPLTIFAFLGGALAIGVGFGTQTLLKNFISGIILLFERPLKVGDVIEVAGITGTIKLIGIRASVIQHFDGIETLVPNSILLENQLTNWTFSNTVIRHFILVGVAYGSPTREVSHLLLAVAKDHGLVKEDPAPEVRFDNFADNSLTFSLLFWFDTRKTSRGTLASDLRFMIDKTFAEAGIVISFPQRDLHFDPQSPLRVELTRSKP
jgi:small-conductance mechanosensitive channel